MRRRAASSSRAACACESAPRTELRDSPRAGLFEATVPQSSGRSLHSASFTIRKPKEKAVGGRRHSASCCDGVRRHKAIAVSRAT